jgi:hypothetical protein
LAKVAVVERRKSGDDGSSEGRKKRGRSKDRSGRGAKKREGREERRLSEEQRREQQVGGGSRTVPLSAPPPLLTLASPSFSPVLDPCCSLADPHCSRLPPFPHCPPSSPATYLCSLLPASVHPTSSSLAHQPERLASASPHSPTLRTVFDTLPVRHQYPGSMAHEVFPVS